MGESFFSFFSQIKKLIKTKTEIFNTIYSSSVFSQTHYLINHYVYSCLISIKFVYSTFDSLKLSDYYPEYCNT